jgi:CBS domain-containing protein
MPAQTAKEVMSESPITVTSKQTLQEVANLMNQHDVGFIPVVEGSKPIGVVTDRDLVIRGIAVNLPASTPIEQVMSKTCVTVEPHHSISQAAETMAQHQIRRILVVDKGQLLGIVALGDLAVREISNERAGKALSQISE